MLVCTYYVEDSLERILGSDVMLRKVSKELGVILQSYQWDGTINGLPKDRPCLVYLSCLLTADAGRFLQVARECNRKHPDVLCFNEERYVDRNGKWNGRAFERRLRQFFAANQKYWGKEKSTWSIPTRGD